MVLLIMLVSEFAGAVRTHEILVNAAREGARLAVTPGELNLTSDVTQRVVAYAQANGVPITTADVTVDQGRIVNPGAGACSATNPCINASQVSVFYSYPLPILSKLPFGLPSSATLGAAVEMRNFY